MASFRLFRPSFGPRKDVTPRVGLRTPIPRGRTNGPTGPLVLDGALAGQIGRARANPEDGQRLGGQAGHVCRKVRGQSRGPARQPDVGQAGQGPGLPEVDARQARQQPGPDLVAGQDQDEEEKKMRWPQFAMWPFFWRDDDGVLGRMSLLLLVLVFF